MRPSATLIVKRSAKRSWVRVLFSLLLLASFATPLTPGQAAAAAGACEALFAFSPQASAEAIEKQYAELREKLETAYVQASAKMNDPFEDPKFRRKTTQIVEAYLLTVVKHLEHLGVNTRLTVVMTQGKPRPEPAIEISPEGSALLNRIARRIRDHLGIKLLFDPYEQWFVHGIGVFNPGHSINTSLRSIQTGEADHTLKHEVRHALIESTLSRGHTSPLLVRVYGRDNQPLPGFKENEAYADFFIFNEALTHTADLLNWGREALRLSKAEALVLETSVVRKVGLVSKFNQTVGTLLGELGPLKEKALKRVLLFNVNTFPLKEDPSRSRVSFNAHLDGKLYAFEMKAHETRPDLLSITLRLRGGDLEFTLPHEMSADEGFIKEKVLPSVIEIIHQLNAAQKDISPRITAIEEAVGQGDFTEFKARTWELRDYLNGLHAGKATHR